MTFPTNAPQGDQRRPQRLAQPPEQAVTTPVQVQTAVEAARRSGRTSVLLLVKRGTGPEAFIGVDIAPPR